jgi:hypothetical protein
MPPAELLFLLPPFFELGLDSSMFSPVKYHAITHKQAQAQGLRRQPDRARAVWKML